MDSWITRVVGFAICTGLLLLWLWLYVTRGIRFDRLGRRDVAVRVLAAMGAVVSASILFGAKGYMLLRTTLDHSLPIVLVVAITFFAPLVAAVGAFLWLVKEVRALRQSTFPAGPDVQRWVEGLEVRMGLRCGPAVRIGSFLSGVPFVTGCGLGRAVLVLPKGLQKNLGLPPRGDGEPGSEVAEFVVLHELGHLRDGDHIFLPWARTLLALWPWWLGLPLAAGTIGCSLYPARVIPREWAMLSLMLLASGFVLRFCFASVCQTREFLADARASLTISGERLRALLTSAEGESACVLLRALWGFERLAEQAMSEGALGLVASAANAAWVRSLAVKHYGSRFGRLVSRLYRSFFCQHPHAEERVEALRAETYTMEGRDVIETEGSLVLGLSWGILVCTLTLVLSGAIFLPQGPARNPNMQSLPGTGTVVVMFAVSILVTAIAFTMPVRSYRSSLRQPKPGWHRRELRSVGWACMASLIPLLILAAACPILAINLLITSVFVWSAVYVLAGGVLFGILPMPHLGGKAVKRIFTVSIGCVCGLAAVFITVVLGYSRVHQVSYVTLAIAAGLPLLLSLGLALIVLRSVGGTLVEGWREFYLFRSFGNTFRAMAPFNASLVVVIAVVGLALLWALIFLGTLQMPFLLSLYQKHEDLSVTVIMGISLWLVVVLVRLDRTKSRDELRAGWYDLMLTCETQGESALRDWVALAQCQEVLLEGMPRLRAVDGGYKSRRSFTVGTADTSFVAIRALNVLGIRREDPELRAFILNCQAKGGGFGPWSQARPSLATTYWCLGVLQAQDLMDQVDSDLHAGWIRCQLTDVWPLERGDCLEAWWYALESLEILGGTAVQISSSFQEHIENQWRRSDQDFDSTFFAVRCLSLSGGIPHAMQMVLTSAWIPQRAAQVRHISVERNLRRVWQFVKIVQMVDGSAAVDMPGLLDRMMPHLDRAASQAVSALTRI